MTITSQPFVRFTSFNFWLVGLRALYQLGHLPTTGSAMAPLADPLDPRLTRVQKQEACRKSHRESNLDPAVLPRLF